VAFGLNDLGSLGVDQGLVEKRDQLANQTALIALKCAEHLEQFKIMVGHRSVAFVSCNEHFKDNSVVHLHEGPKDLHPLKGRQREGASAGSHHTTGLHAGQLLGT
jgi:hypothetical protein